MPDTLAPQPETQDGIAAWAEATFGPAGSDARVVIRALEETAELLLALHAREPEERCATEAADTVIVLCRAAARLGTRIDWRVPPAASPLMEQPHYLTAQTFALKANESLVSVLRLIALGTPGGAATDLHQAVHLLACAARALGHDIGARIDAKMAINRAREWRLDGSGHGYHVKG